VICIKNGALGLLEVMDRKGIKKKH